MEQERPVESAFADLDNHELVDQFYVTEGDPVIGKELSIRLLAHAGFKGDATTEPLLGRDGIHIQDQATGQPLVLADYINFATEHHFHALEGILGFLRTQPNQPSYETGRKIILTMLGQQTADQG